MSWFLARSLAAAACLALLAGGATLAIAAKGGRSGSPTPAHIQYSDKPGAQGCTPGYWKNHTSVWVGYGPGQPYRQAFASGTPEPLKDRLDGLNNAGCSIDAHGRPVD